MYNKIFPDRLKCRINPVVVLTARQLGGEAAKVVDAKTPRCKEAKSVTEIKVVKTISSKQK